MYIMRIVFSLSLNLRVRVPLGNYVNRFYTFNVTFGRSKLTKNVIKPYFKFVKKKKKCIHANKMFFFFKKHSMIQKYVTK